MSFISNAFLILRTDKFGKLAGLADTGTIVDLKNGKKCFDQLRFVGDNPLPAARARNYQWAP
jgi:hypothetical protein